MRTDQSSSAAAAEHRHSLAYSNRWQAMEIWCRMAMQEPFSPPLLAYQEVHRRRLIYLHQCIHIPMKIIARHALDDPRLSDAELQARLQQYRMRKQVYDSLKRKRGK